MRRFGALLAAMALAAGGAACNDDAGAVAATVVSEGESFADVPAPEGDTVLTITGATGTPNDGDAISFDLATLERLRLEEWTLPEPFLDRDATFVGVPVEDLLSVVGIPDGAQSVRMVALDEYEIVMTIEDLTTGGVMVAVADDVEEGTIPVERGGPIRIVFAGDDPSADNPDLWIWSLRTMAYE